MYLMNTLLCTCVKMDEHISRDTVKQSRMSIRKILAALWVFKGPVPVAVRSKAWVCGCSPAEIVGSNHAEGMDVCLLLVLCVVR